MQGRRGGEGRGDREVGWARTWKLGGRGHSNYTNVITNVSLFIIIIENTNYRGLAFVVTGRTDGQTDRQTLFGVESWSTLTLFRPTRII